MPSIAAKKLSVVIPVYNEESTIIQVIKRVQNVETGLACEILIVDEGSIDSTRSQLDN